MRVTNRTWPVGNIVDVFPIDKDPGPGVAINPKHALMVIRGIPTDVSGFVRVKSLLTQINFLDDADKNAEPLDKRRWLFNVPGLTTRERNAIRDLGRLEITWADVSPVCIRKTQGTVPTRSIENGDISG